MPAASACYLPDFDSKLVQLTVGALKKRQKKTKAKTIVSQNTLQQYP